jgi:adenosine deaminase
MHKIIILSINSDDPGVFGNNTTAFDFLICAIYWEWTLEEIKESLYESINCSLFSDEIKKKIKEDFEAKWIAFNE